MKKILSHFSVGLLAFFFLSGFNASAQDLEWRLVNPTFNSTDPDGAGPATGSATFTLQIHTVSGSLPDVSAISTGWSWQSARAMLPTTGPIIPTCGTTSIQQPSNVTMSPTFAALGFTYNYVNQCSGSVNLLAGGQAFDRRSAGTIDGGIITLTTTWLDVFTVTIWTTGTTNPKGGYVAINSGAGSLIGAFPTYTVSNTLAEEFVVNSLTWNTPLAVGLNILPVRFTKVDAECLPNNTSLVSWTTAEEINSSHFEVEKSVNGIDWKQIGRINAAGNSSIPKNYEFNDQQGGTAQYRLKQVDKDGKTTYSSIARTTCETKNVYVKLYPVPARDFVNLVIGSDRQAKTTIQVFDNKGKLVMNMPVVLSNGQNNFRLNVQNFAAGEYYIRGTDPAVDISKRFTVVR